MWANIIQALIIAGFLAGVVLLIWGLWDLRRIRRHQDQHNPVPPPYIGREEATRYIRIGIAIWLMTWTAMGQAFFYLNSRIDQLYQLLVQLSK